MWIKKKEIKELSEQIRKAIDGKEIDPRDHKEGVLSILKNDIYTLIRMEEEQRREEQKEREHLAEYLTDISHQLKTPVTSMILMANLVEDAPKEKQKEFLFRMKKELDHMQWLVAALLKMAKLDAKVVEFIPTEVSTDDLVNLAAEPLEILLDIKNQEIQILHDIPIRCDKRWTVEALTNLLKNASESSNQDTIIVVDSGENPIYQWISVTDAGEGIPRERMAHLFRRFENSQSENGYGVGLPLAQSIIRGQNGELEVDPGGRGKGATFTIKLYR